MVHLKEDQLCQKAIGVGYSRFPWKAAYTKTFRKFWLGCKWNTRLLSVPLEIFQILNQFMFTISILCNSSGCKRSLGYETFKRTRVSQTNDSNCFVRHLKLKKSQGWNDKKGTAVDLLNLFLFSSVYFTLSCNFSSRRVFWGFTILTIYSLQKAGIFFPQWSTY